MKCNPHTIQQQLHTFGKGGAASRKSKWGRVIKPNPPAISARLAPGSGPGVSRTGEDKWYKHIAIPHIILEPFSTNIQTGGSNARWTGGHGRKSTSLSRKATTQFETCY